LAAEAAELVASKIACAPANLAFNVLSLGKLVLQKPPRAYEKTLTGGSDFGEAALHNRDGVLLVLIGCIGRLVAFGNDRNDDLVAIDIRSVAQQTRASAKK
jgi:hypothetical protein